MLTVRWRINNWTNVITCQSTRLGKCAEPRSNILFVFLIVIYYHGQLGVMRRSGKAASGGEKVSLPPRVHTGKNEQ
ncbi:hypothetical protein BN1007_40235 [Klebsiella variicola]|nr:hypothetical protein BN1007_40235 [Klebsiella variicola]